MTNSILVGQYIYKRLQEHPKLKEFVGDRIFPLVAENSTKSPFIIYWRNSIINNVDTKDGINEDTVTFTVQVVDNQYNQSLMLANYCRKALETMRYEDKQNGIYECKMTDIDEAFVENVFVQTMEYTCIYTN